MLIADFTDDQWQPAPKEEEADFKTEYHSHSKCPTLFQMADEFCIDKSFMPPPDTTSWCPFQCKDDFKFAEIALNASLNKGQVNALLDLISHISKSQAQIMFKNEDELHKACDMTAEELTLIC